MWITNGTVADVGVLMAKTNPGEGHRGITAFLVDMDWDGIKTEKIDNKLGIRASDLAEVIIDDVRIPEENVIGEVDKGFYQLMEFFAAGRTNVAAQAVGAAPRVRSTPLSSTPTSASSSTRRSPSSRPSSTRSPRWPPKVEAARSLTYRAATQVEQENQDIAAQYSSMAKYFASEISVEVADEGIPGPRRLGLRDGLPAERYYRDARITKIYEGTSEIQKNIIADQIL